MTPQEFVQKWSRIQLKEATAAQSHFNDLCRLVGELSPLEADPAGAFFTFEATTAKNDGRPGRADVWYKGKFIWEYKGLHANLDKAYQQLQLYREALGNPPLLIVSDLHTIIIHTNFENTIKEKHEITFERLLKGDGLTLLKRIFSDPESFRPGQTQIHVTEANAETFLAVIQALRKHQQITEQHINPEQLAHFVIRLLFCMFAEDLGLLPHTIFSQLVNMQDDQFTHFRFGLQNLFQTMRSGGLYGFYKIRYFDGGLFDDEFVPDLPPDLGQALRQAVNQDWSGVDPSIFGTLFERVIDEEKRVQLGAHYTSRTDILLVVEPIVMKPLRDEWVQVKRKAATEPTQLAQFTTKLAAIRVLDPACGSGNFLYIALRQLLDLQKEVIVYGQQFGLDLPLTVSPAQLYGLEINPYAHELAQITVWIGYLQWRFENGFANLEEPILRPLKNIERRDAILTYDGDGRPVAPIWPQADFIIGNPPFLGDKKMRRELGQQYVDDLRQLYRDHIPGQSDLVCYWFEQARTMIAQQKAGRVGLLATQGIRNGANQTVLRRIKQTGNIFWAYSDRNWVLDGATVHVSMVGFDNGSDPIRLLDGRKVRFINADLQNFLDFSNLKPLAGNKGLSFIGTQKNGPFNLTREQGEKMLVAVNPDGRSNQEVIKPWINALDVTRRPRQMRIVDFGPYTSLEEAAKYILPFEHVQNLVKPARERVNRYEQRKEWWLFERPRPGLRAAISSLKRFIVTPMVSKHRLFVWVEPEVVPENLLVVIARDDDYFFGVLSSSIHELWARRLASQLREAESGTRYTPTTTFETFPFPWVPGREPPEDQNSQLQAIAQAARNLDRLRQSWLNPPEIGITISQRQVNQRTLTNLYNALSHYRANVKGQQRNQNQWRKESNGLISLEQIEELDTIHAELDRAVLAAYNWPAALTDDQILEELLALNLEREGMAV